MTVLADVESEVVNKLDNSGADEHIGASTMIKLAARATREELLRQMAGILFASSAPESLIVAVQRLCHRNGWSCRGVAGGRCIDRTKHIILAIDRITCWFGCCILAKSNWCWSRHAAKGKSRSRCGILLSGLCTNCFWCSIDTTSPKGRLCLTGIAERHCGQVSRLTD